MISVAKTHRCKCGGLRHKCDIQRISALTAENSKQRVMLEAVGSFIAYFRLCPMDLCWDDDATVKLRESFTDFISTRTK